MSLFTDIWAAVKRQAAKTSEGDLPEVAAQELSKDLADAIELYVGSRAIVVNATGATAVVPIPAKRTVWRIIMIPSATGAVLIGTTNGGNEVAEAELTASTTAILDVGAWSGVSGMSLYFSGMSGTNDIYIYAE